MYKDLKGQKYGRLTVLSKASNLANKTVWLCQCECGNEKVVRTDHLHSGSTTSCGCLHKEVIGKISRTHGASDTSEYKAWESMRRRCDNPRDSSYHNYGGRGITVCERWNGENGSSNFLADMGPKPSSEHSVEREDVNGNYEPNNCKWATRTEQARNRRNTVYVNDNGLQVTLVELAERQGFDADLVRRRIKRGISLENAIFKSRVRIDDNNLVPYKSILSDSMTNEQKQKYWNLINSK